MFSYLASTPAKEGGSTMVQGTNGAVITNSVLFLEKFMQLSVIYSIDTPRDVSIAQFNPPKSQKRVWQLTENDSGYEFGYLEGRWTKGKHRKWCALLTREQFDDFIDHTNLFAEDVATMGSLGAPGCGFGWAPAFSFRIDDPDCIANAYVTPLASGPEMAQFLTTVNDEYEADLPVPGILTDSLDQGYLFDGVVEAEATAAERSIRSAFCTIWGS